MRDVIQYLNSHASTIYRLLARGEIPRFKLGGDWRFRRSDVDNWIFNLCSAVRIVRNHCACGMEG